MRFIPRGNLRECLDVDMMSLQHAHVTNTRNIVYSRPWSRQQTQMELRKSTLIDSVNEEGAMVTQHLIEIRENVNVSN